MAGSFGFEAEHYDLSRQVGELRLFPALRGEPADTVVAATGVSCRQQIGHFAGRTARHPVVLVAEAAGLAAPRAPAPVLDDPEPPRADEREQLPRPRRRDDHELAPVRPRPCGQLDREVDDRAVGERRVAEVEEDDPAGGERGARGGVAQHGEGGEVELAAGRELDAGPDLGERADRIVVRCERCGLGGTEHGIPRTRGRGPGPRGGSKRTAGAQVLTTPAGARRG